jgi:NitT/TauT family transport system substrate-binding protein
VVGKTVATSTFSSSNTLWPVILESNGIDPKGQAAEGRTRPRWRPCWRKASVDATINWVTVAPASSRCSSRRQGPEGAALVRLRPRRLRLVGLASDKIIKERPDTLKRYLRALNKALQFSIANPEKAAAGLKAHVVPKPTPR